MTPEEKAIFSEVIRISDRKHDAWDRAKEILAREAEDRWIEIKEESGPELYPDNNQEVLIYTEPVISNAVYTDRNGRGFEFLNLAFSFGNTQPTHWRPLPKSPKS